MRGKIEIRDGHSQTETPDRENSKRDETALDQVGSDAIKLLERDVDRARPLFSCC
jgi:hypothetical protein